MVRKVYVLTEQVDLGVHVRGVFSSQENAKLAEQVIRDKRIERMGRDFANDHFQIEECEMDELVYI